MQIDRLRWLVKNNKYLTIDGAAEIAKAAPSILRALEAGIKSPVDISRDIKSGMEIAHETASPTRSCEQ